MLISHRDSLLLIILLSSVLVTITFIGILLILKYRKYHSRPYIPAACFFLSQTLGIVSILTNGVVGNLNGSIIDSVLPPDKLIFALLPFFCLLAYVSEIKNPGKLNLKIGIASIFPAVVISAILLARNPKPLHSVNELWDNIGQADVWLRLVFASLFVIYPVVLAAMPCNWHKCLVSRKILYHLYVLTILVSPVFLAGLMCGYFPAIILNFFIVVAMSVIIWYTEFRVRIPVSPAEAELNLPANQSDGHSIDSPEVWMNPDMSASELAKKMKTNRIYLSNEIKALGYASYSDMVNRKRIDFICKELEKDNGRSIIQLMYEAGFRSRSTASREFKHIVGCTPSEYLDRIKNQ